MTDSLRHALAEALGPSFELGDELRGGMARVFVARDTVLDRRVVVKTLGELPLDGPQADRFRREILLAAALQHPNIVPLLSAGTTRDGTPYYVMPFVEGETLRHRLARGAVAPHEVAALTRDVARALGAAHRRGIVHRDIKPENIFIADGIAMVGDFGVAKAVDAALPSRATATGVAIGTPAYMAPEQAGAEPGVGARADLYALGLVAWELLAGRHPFEGRSAAGMLAAVLTEPVPPIASVVPAVPLVLAAMVDALLQKDPARRPADAETVVITLATVTTPAETMARSAAADAVASPAPESGSAPRAKRRPWAAIGITAAAAVFLAVFALVRLGPVSSVADASPGDPAAVAWRVPVTAVRVPAADSLARAVVGPALTRVRGLSLVPMEAATAPDSVSLEVRVSDGALLFARPGESPVAAIPLSLPREELLARAAGTLAVMGDENLGEWSLPRGLPPRLESVERFQALDRIRLSRAGSTAGEMAQLVRGYDEFGAAIPDWPAPILFSASRIGAWDGSGAFVARTAARGPELTFVEQRLVDLYEARVRRDAGRVIAALRDLVRETRFSEFGRYYATALGSAKQLREAAQLLQSLGPGPGQEHLGYYSDLSRLQHTAGLHEAELATMGEAMRESGVRVGMRWRHLRALAALDRPDALREALREAAGLPSDAFITYGWVLATIGDELAVHGNPTAARARYEDAARWYEALLPGERTSRTFVEWSMVRARLGDAAGGRAILDDAPESARDRDLMLARALAAAHAGDSAAADSLFRDWVRLPPARLSPDDLVARSYRWSNGSHPGDSTIMAARLASLRGDAVSAQGLIRAALDGGWRTWVDVVHFDPDFARVRGEPAVRAALGAP